MKRTHIRSLIVAATLSLAASLAACGGGGGGGGGTIPPPATTATPAVAPTYTVSGAVSQIPSDAYGPTTIGSQTYASADAASTTPLANATVVIGPAPVVGATLPALLPAGDVATTTNASGAFTVTLTIAPAVPLSVEAFVVPAQNLSGFTPPATGYYVEVFASNADGKSGGIPIPLHGFFAQSLTLMLHVTSPSAAYLGKPFQARELLPAVAGVLSRARQEWALAAEESDDPDAAAEANALAQLNSDRATNAGVGPLTFDESAEEVARLHVSDEVAHQYGCHYDRHNVGPSSRYLAAGGMGLTGEGLGYILSATTVDQGFAGTESGFLAEKTQSPPGGHYANLVDSAHVWAGLAASVATGVTNVDYELVTANAQDSVVGASGYPATGVCPAGTVVNNS